MSNYREEVVESTAREEAPGKAVTFASTAADGGILPGPARSAGSFIDLLEDGQFSAEVHRELQDLAAQMRAVANSTGGKAKGEATLKLKLELEGEAFKIEGDVKIKAPSLPRPRSIMWQDDSGAFTRFPPNQSQLFGSMRRI